MLLFKSISDFCFLNNFQIRLSFFARFGTGVRKEKQKCLALQFWLLKFTINAVFYIFFR